MRRLRDVTLLVLGILIGSIGSVMAVSFTVDLTQTEIDVITWEWNREDASHSTWATGQLFAAAKVKAMVAGWKSLRQANRVAYLGSPTGVGCLTFWAGLSAGNRNTICTGSLGEVTGCTACDVNGN